MKSVRMRVLLFLGLQLLIGGLVDIPVLMYVPSERVQNVYMFIWGIFTLWAAIKIMEKLGIPL